MALHLIKLCVGITDPGHLREAQARRLELMRKSGDEPLLAHITRHRPRRASELLDGGSLYWVIKGRIQVRQKLTGIIPFTDQEGVGRCKLALDPDLVLVRPAPRRAFQGWRYLDATDAPPDIAGNAAQAEAMPQEMRAELMEMGLL